MISKHPNKLASFALKFTGAMSVIACLSACSVADPLTVRSITEASTPATMRIAMAMPDGDANAPTALMATALQASFEAQNFAIATDGDLIADYGLAIAPATIGVRRSISEAEIHGSDWLFPPRNVRRFDECDAKELRGVLLLLNRDTSEVVYRGKALIVDCDFGPSEISALADGLVTDFVATREP